HLGHSTADAHYSRRHPAASTRVARGRPTSAHGAAAPEARTASRTAAPDPGTAGSAPVRAGAAANQLGFRTSASVDPGGTRLPDAAVFVTGALAGAVLTSLGRLRHRQRQERRRGRRIALPADPEVLATEQRLRAATTYAVPVETLRDALACLQSGIVGAGQELPDIVGLHVTPDVLEVLLNAPAADAPPAPYSISPGRQGMCWQLDLPAIVTVQDAAGPTGLPCHLLPGLITAGATEAGYLLLDLESVQVMGCDGPSALVHQVVATIATELATGQWSGWYDLVLVGCDELDVLGRAEHCATVDDALDRLEARCAAVAHRLAARAPADVRELRLAEPDNEDWGLAILVSRVEPSPEQLTRMLRLAEEGSGGFAALVAGDPETADGRMAPTVLQLAPDPDVREGIAANVIPLQITVRPRALSASDYDAISSLLAVAAGLDDVGANDEPYLGYGAPPWIPQAASLQLRPGAESADWANDDGDSGLAPRPAAHPADGADLPGYRTEGPRPVPSQPLEVKILGPFTITGSAEPLQPKQAELVLALALAVPAGLSNSAL
ncbi:MAG TPA: hypothetical protein VK836_03470, partial [Streptosporangiaceae bacterium]|nr:hypothetical protein [Streptosporangiaceae bacterium]